ncbi:MAG: demethoxyubiquinone hydroxylase family protein [Rhodovibrionaceae bacterium]
MSENRKAEAPPRQPRYAPGDLTGRQRLERILRVDHAGEYGARRIYEGQLAVLKRSASRPAIQRMWEQEAKHLDYFERALPDRRVRPTLLQPLWHVAGFALGAATAALGERAAMACTVAVEEVIDQHYASQQDALGEDEPELSASIAEFRAEELEHRDTGLAHEAEQAPAYPLLSAVIKAGSRAAIWLSERV